MMIVTKVYTPNNEVIYFINGSRSEAMDDTEALRELLGNSLEEYWIVDPETEVQEVAASLIEAAESREELEELLDSYPEAIVDV